MPLEFLISAFVTLVVVLDPIGLAPTFIAVTHGMPRASRTQVALRASLIAAAILAGTALIGAKLLSTIAISLPAFRIAGGLLLFAIAAQMVFGLRIQQQVADAEQALEERVRNVAAFPLAIPLMAGPGAITATVLLSGRTGGDPWLLASLIGIAVIGIVLCFLSFLAATRIAKLLGITGNVVLSRLLGVLLAALAVQFVIDGVVDSLRALAAG